MHTPNIAKLAILEYQKPFSARDLLQPRNRAVPKVRNDVRVCLENTDTAAGLLGHREQLGGGCDICAQCEVALLDTDQV